VSRANGVNITTGGKIRGRSAIARTPDFARLISERAQTDGGSHAEHHAERCRCQTDDQAVAESVIEAVDLISVVPLPFPVIQGRRELNYGKDQAAVLELEWL
jgi:hypothetical protein